MFLPAHKEPGHFVYLLALQSDWLYIATFQQYPVEAVYDAPGCWFQALMQVVPVLIWSAVAG